MFMANSTKEQICRQPNKHHFVMPGKTYHLEYQSNRHGVSVPTLKRELSFGRFFHTGRTENCHFEIFIFFLLFIVTPTQFHNCIRWRICVYLLTVSYSVSISFDGKCRLVFKLFDGHFTSWFEILALLIWNSMSEMAVKRNANDIIEHRFYVLSINIIIDTGFTRIEHPNPYIIQYDFL